MINFKFSKFHRIMSNISVGEANGSTPIPLLLQQPFLEFADLTVEGLSHGEELLVDGLD